MRTTREPDNLDICAKRATDAGMSYGHYMTLHPCVPTQEAEALPDDCPRCAHCGQPFCPWRAGIRYCSDDCRTAAHRRQARERYRKRKEAEAG